MSPKVSMFVSRSSVAGNAVVDQSIEVNLAKLSTKTTSPAAVKDKSSKITKSGCPGEQPAIGPPVLNDQCEVSDHEPPSLIQK